MVKNSLFAITFFFSLSFAAEFTASVNKTEVSLNESVSLNLTLKGTSPKEAPSISALKNHFLIESQHQSNNTIITNGKISSSITWKLSLTPKAEGVLEIPSIAIDTAEGRFSTKPITLNVIKKSTGSNGESAQPSVITKVSNTSPYKNEPLIYTALLTSKTPLYNIQSAKIEIENAIVEILEEPKLKEKVLEGVLLNVVEFSYLITPLKPGPLTIPPIVIRGAIPEKRRGAFNSFYEDDSDPFAFMPGFNRLKSFTLMTENISLDIKPSLPEVSPWIAAKELTLTEEFSNDQIIRVGEPLSRELTIHSIGLKTSQLPHLEEHQNSSFKVYSDKPEETQKIVDDVIYSTRKERYTLIPEQAGTWTLPEISINWWDSVKKEKRTTTLKARKVEILPSLKASTSAAPPIISGVKEEAPPSSTHTPILLYTIILLLTFFITALLIWGFALQRKMNKLTQEPFQKPIKSVTPFVKTVQKKKKEKLPDLNPT